ncbi:hypothetical protein ACFLQJ_00200 [Calditrichota bacterium]
MLIELLLVGFLSILGQVVLLRELNIASYGIELIYILALGAWLFWTACGAILGKFYRSLSLKHIWSLIIISSYLLLFSMIFIRSSHAIFKGVPGAYLPFFQQIVLVNIGVVPVAVSMGILFQWTARKSTEIGKTLALAYGIESLGGMIGGLVSTFCLKLSLQNFTIMILSGIIAIVIVLFRSAIVTGSKRFFSLNRLIIIIVLLSQLVLLMYSSSLDRMLTTIRHPELLASKDTPYGRVIITQRQGQLTVYTNNSLAYETQSIVAEEFVQLAMISHPNVKSVLLLGGGVEGVIPEILENNPQRLDYVDFNKWMFELVLDNMPDSLILTQKLEAVNIIYQDPRSYLNGEGSYDLILVAMPDPVSLQDNRYYTSQFFRLCKNSLNPGGILAFRVRSAENYWTYQLTQKMGAIYRALTSVFEDAIILPGATNVVLASSCELPRDPKFLAERFTEKNLTTRLVSAPFIEYKYSNDRFDQVNQSVRQTGSPINSDNYPIAYRQALLSWLSRFFPDIANLEFSWKKSNCMMVMIIFPLIVFALIMITGKRKRLRPLVFVAFAGFAGMVLETVLIMQYQVKTGVLFQDFGILLMLFMGGLALGSLLLDRISRQQRKSGSFPKWIGYAIVASLLVLCLVAYLSIHLDLDAGLANIGILLFLSGTVTSACFAWTAIKHPEKQSFIISPLYAADLAGGCVGSILASLLLLPFFGATSALLILAIMCIPVFGVV